MKRSKRYAFRAFVILGTVIAVLSAVRLMVWQPDARPDSTLTPPSAAPELHAIRKPDAWQPPSHADKLRREMVQVLAALQEESGPMAFENRASKAQNAIAGLASEDIPAALAFVAALHDNGPADSSRADLELRLVQRWAEQDINSAAGWSLTAPPDIREETCRRIGSLWGERNLTEAISWASEIEDAKLKETALLAVASEAANSSPLTALETCASPSAKSRTRGDHVPCCGKMGN